MIYVIAMNYCRCFAIHLLGILMFKELHSGQLFSRCDEAMDILFASLQVQWWVCITMATCVMDIEVSFYCGQL